jgi:hypothetical protein
MRIVDRRHGRPRYHAANHREVNLDNVAYSGIRASPRAPHRDRQPPVDDQINLNGARTRRSWT